MQAARKATTTMAQKLIQTQDQRLQQVQRLSAQQMLQVRMLEMPLRELEENVKAELDDNPALDAAAPDDALSHTGEGGDADATSDAPTGDGDDFDTAVEREERHDALNDALEGIGRDDEMPVASYRTQQDGGSADYEEMVWGDTTSFYDKLKEQMGETDLTPDEAEIMTYLIGSLDSDGLLRRDTGEIAEELAIYQNLYTTKEEVDEVLHKLQTFDPPGIGAHDLRECLLLQIDRRRDDDMKPLMRRVIAQCFDDFTKKHWNRIAQTLGIGEDKAERLRGELRRLNPKPGASLGEAEGRSLQQITPDFIVDTDDDGHVTFTLNGGDVPELTVSPSFMAMADAWRNNRKSMSRRDREALLYAKEKVERAQGYIESIKQRRRTLCATMQAIIDWQLRFFQDGDEADLKPMILKNIADRTGLDISTVSRVSNVKWAQTNWGTFPLRFFFSDGYDTGDGETLSTRKIKLALKEVIDSEDKRKPLSDDAITRALADKGFPIARRTVAKYREQMGIPVARLRR